jgi:hypothetical protein
MSSPLHRTGDRDAGASRRNVRGRLALPAVVVLTALAGSAPALATPIPTAGGPTPIVQPGPAAPGIIMRDGGICDPIRHMGC